MLLMKHIFNYFNTNEHKELLNSKRDIAYEFLLLTWILKVGPTLNLGILAQLIFELYP